MSDRRPRPTRERLAEIRGIDTSREMYPKGYDSEDVDRWNEAALADLLAEIDALEDEHRRDQFAIGFERGGRLKAEDALAILAARGVVLPKGRNDV